MSSTETSSIVGSALGRQPSQAAVPAAPLVRRRSSHALWRARTTRLRLKRQSQARGRNGDGAAVPSWRLRSARRARIHAIARVRFAGSALPPGAFVPMQTGRAAAGAALPLAVHLGSQVSDRARYSSPRQAVAATYLRRGAGWMRAFLPSSASRRCEGLNAGDRYRGAPALREGIPFVARSSGCSSTAAS